MEQRGGGYEQRGPRRPRRGSWFEGQDDDEPRWAGKRRNSRDDHDEQEAPAVGSPSVHAPAKQDKKHHQKQQRGGVKRRGRQASPSPSPSPGPSDHHQQQQPPQQQPNGRPRAARGQLWSGGGPSFAHLEDYGAASDGDDGKDYDDEDDDDDDTEEAEADAGGGQAGGRGRPWSPSGVGRPEAGCRVATLADGQRVVVVDEDEGASPDAPEQQQQQPAAGPPRPEFDYGQQCSLEEDGEHEFKAVQNSQHPLERIALYCEHYVNAFLNSDGGTIYFGIDDDGRVLGVPLNRKQRDHLRLRIDSIVSAFKPQVDPYLLRVNFLKVRVCDGPATSSSTSAAAAAPVRPCGLRFVVEVVVERGRAPVYFTPHQSAYIRRAGSVYKMDGSMVDERKRMGRPILPARRSQEEPKRGPPVFVSRPPPTGTPALTGLDAVSTAITPPPAPAAAAALSGDGAGPAPPAVVVAAAAAESADGPASGGVGAAASAPSSAGMVASPSSPNDFVGRERELQQITEFVDANHPRHGKPRATNLVILLYGLPVVGKSALARRLMAEFAERYPDFHFQINMKGVASASGYISLTDAMVGVIRSVHPTLALPLDNLPAIRGIYESCFKGRQCMLLIENVGSVEQITPLLPVTSKSCLAVATSRKDLSLDIALGTETTLSVKLSAMTPGDAAQLVQSLLPHASADEARELARLCGDLPLPIRLIGGVLRRKPNLTIAAMIKKLENNDVQLMAMLESSLGVADEEYPPEVYDAMRSLCLFPATFDGCAATALLDKTYEEAEDILGVLLEYSLLDFDLATGRYHMNDLVRSHALHKALAADARVVEVLRERFVQYFLGQLSTCRALLVQQPGPATADPSRGDGSSSSSSAAKERAALLFTRERYNFDACAKFLRQSPALSQGTLAREFAETLAAVTCCLGHTAATPSPTAVAPTPTPLPAAPSAAAAAVEPRDDPAAEPKTADEGGGGGGSP